MISQAARHLGKIGGAVAFGFVLCACSAHQPRSHGSGPAARSGDVIERKVKPARRLSVGEKAAVIAVRQLGAPYRYGGSAADGFDCSGLVHYAYSKAGKAIPRTTRGQWNRLQPVAADNLQVGDLLFFDISGKVAHVGLYLGSRRFVHAPSSGHEVTIEELDSDYYRRAFVRGGRP